MPSAAPADPVARDLAFWRRRILATTLRGAALFGIVAYVPSVTLLAYERQWAIIVVDTVVYAAVLALIYSRRLSYLARVFGLLALVGFLGLVLSMKLGSIGSGLMWLMMLPVFTAILLGLRSAVVALACLAVAGGVVGVGIASGHVRWFVTPDWTRGREVSSWFVNVANAIMLSGAASLSIAVLLRGLGEANEALAREIAERARAEQERHILEAQLRDAQKMEAVGRIAGGIAHDFNNLLVPILGYSELVRQDLPPDSPSQQFLDDVVRSGERARGLVQRLLSFSRQAHLVRTPVRLDDVIRDNDGLVRAAVPRTIVFDYVLTAIDPTVLADAGEISQILMNLVANAGYAMRQDGGRLTIGLANGPAPGEVRLTVADTGRGMDAETRARAFEPFYTTKPAGEGSGLGLATVRTIVKDLGGRVSLESSPQGTRIDVNLPRAPHGPAPAPRTPRAPAASAVSRDRHVLLVDDEPDVLRTGDVLLRDLGYRVTAVSSGANALARLTSPDRIDLLLTDHAMPVMTGLALAEAVHPQFPGLPIVLASGFLDEAAQRRLDAAGIIRVLSKPYTAAELGAAVDAALAPAPSADAQG